jgi:hypothetical protein
MRLFFEFSPPEVVKEHLQRLVRTVPGDWTVLDDNKPGDRPEGQR